MSLLIDVSENGLMSTRQCRPRSEATFCCLIWCTLLRIVYGICILQRADELMAEVDTARAKARNAVELGERTLSEANDTYNTLLGELILSLFSK